MLTVVLGSSYHNGVCVACIEPKKGIVVTVITGEIGSSVIALCAEHHNALRAAVNRIGDRREI